MEWGMYGAVDMNREAVVGDEVLAGAHVVDVDCEAMGGGNIVVEARVVDVDRKAIDEGVVFATIVIRPLSASTRRGVK